MFVEISRVKQRLNKLQIDRLHVEGDGIDLRFTVGPTRQWLGGTGHNIPSFEIFTTPDWRGTEGTVAFTEPLHRYGSMIEGVKLRFERGVIVEATATRSEHLLHAMIASDEGVEARRRDLADRRPAEPDHPLHGRDALRREPRRAAGELPSRDRQRLPAGVHR